MGVARANLAAAGFGRDDRLAIIAGNEIDFAVASFAALGLGGQVVPLLPTAPLPEMERKFAASKPTFAVLGDAGQWLSNQGSSLGVPIVDIRTDHDHPVPPIAMCDPEHLAFLMLTSGVTSDAKVAMLSHGNLAWAQNAVQNRGVDGLLPDDVALGVLPFSHIFGLNLVLFATLRVGGSVVLQRRFDAEESLLLVKKHGVTALGGAPPMWLRWMTAAGPDDSFALLRHCSSGAAALPAEVFLGIRERFGIEVAEGYGLTETSPILTWSRGIPVKVTSVGKVIEGVELVLVEPDGSPADPGDTGEIVVRSPGVFKGYLDAPELTNAVLTPDGWFWTGDVGVFDEDGYLYLVDRVKDLIIVSGFNVYPAEVENILLEHPGVRGAVVTGAPALETGEMVVAHVLGTATAEELEAHARSNLSRYKCPVEYRFVDELPVAASGKLIRRELR